MDLVAVDFQGDSARGPVFAEAVGRAKYFAGNANNCMAGNPQVCLNENMSLEFFGY